MYNQLRALALGCVLITVSAVLASAASAQGLSVEKEDNGVPCPNVSYPGAGVATDVDGGCLVHATGETELRKHVFGIESHITSCRGEGWGRTNGSGTGYTIEKSLMSEPSGSACTRQPCKDANGETIPWTHVSSEGTAFGEPEASPPPQYGTENFCIEPVGGGTDESCEIDSAGNAVGGTHVAEAGHTEPEDSNLEMAGHGISGFRCELEGHATSEIGGTHDGDAEVAVEVLHT